MHIKEFIEELRIALEESVRLQSHYAKSLNVLDGGERIVFESAKEWIERLREIGRVPKKTEKEQELEAIKTSVRTAVNKVRPDHERR